MIVLLLRLLLLLYYPAAAAVVVIVVSASLSCCCRMVVVLLVVSLLLSGKRMRRYIHSGKKCPLQKQQRTIPANNQKIIVAITIAGGTSFVVMICFARSQVYYSFYFLAQATGTKELPVELAEGSMKSSDGCGWDGTVLSMLVMDTVIV